MFSVLRVECWCDGPEDVECIKSFSTEDEANGYRRAIEDRRDSDWRTRCEYIDQWVEAMELPKTDYNGWLEYLKQYHPFGASYVFPKDFKLALKNYLRNYHEVKL